MSGQQRTTPRLRQDLRAILGDGAAFSVMVGVGETYLPAFILAIGLGEVASGLVTTLPLLAGAMLQLISPAAVRKLQSHRRWTVTCAICQSLSFLPLIIASIMGHIHLLVAFGAAAVYWGAGLGTGPAWNTWVSTLIPARIRARYFARRTRFAQLGTLLGFVGGGLLLQYARGQGHELWAFAVLFCVASACRATSAVLLSTQSEPVPPSDEHRRVPMWEFIGRFRHGQDGRLLIYLLAVQSAAMIAGPYFAPYMLRVRKFEYWEFVVLIGVSFLTKVIALPFCGRLAHELSARRLLWVGGIGIVPVAGLWLVSQSFYFLLFVQVLAGLTWAAYELAMFLLFFETIPAEERTSVLTTFNFANAVATAVGSLFGAAILAKFGKTEQIYLTLFMASSVARLLTLPLLARVPEFVLDAKPMATRTLGVRAADGSLDQPILGSLEDAEPAGHPAVEGKQG